MKKVFYAKQKRQLRYLTKKLKRLLQLQQNPLTPQIESLRIKIKTLAQELSDVLTPTFMKKVLGSVAVIIGISFSSRVNAQSFAPPQQNPFGLVSVSEDPTPPVLVDLDGDGDLDLLVGRNHDDDIPEFHYYENIGTAANPSFDAPQLNPFGLVGEEGMYLLPAMADIDNDGDFDLLVSEYNEYTEYNEFKYFENIGTSTLPQFGTPVTNPFELDINIGLPAPVFVDLDGDGDMDLFSGDLDGREAYFENVGTPTAPEFGTQVDDPFGLDLIDEYLLPTFADLDEDGDMDLLAGFEDGDFVYFENTGSATSPQFSSPSLNPFGLVRLLTYAVPTFGDLDDDGDLDLLAAEEGNFQYFGNTEIVGVHEAYENIQLDLFPNPVSEILMITTETPFANIEIYGVTGQLYSTHDGSKNSIEVKGLPQGIYLLKFIDEQGQFTTRKFKKE